MTIQTFVTTTLTVDDILTELGIKQLYLANVKNSVATYFRQTVFIQKHDDGTVMFNGADISQPFDAAEVIYRGEPTAYRLMAEHDGGYTVLKKPGGLDDATLLFIGQCKSQFSRDNIEAIIDRRLQGNQTIASIVSDFVRVPTEHMSPDNVYVEILREKVKASLPEGGLVEFVSKLIRNHGYRGGNHATYVVAFAILFGLDEIFDVLNEAHKGQYLSVFYCYKQQQHEYNAKLFLKNGNSMTTLKQFLNTPRIIPNYLNSLPEDDVVIMKIVQILNKSHKTKGYSDRIKTLVNADAISIIKQVDEDIIAKIYPNGCQIGDTVIYQVDEIKEVNPMAYAYDRLTTCGTKSDDINRAASVFFTYINAVSAETLATYESEITYSFGKFLYEHCANTGLIAYGLRGALNTLIVDNKIVNKENLNIVLRYAGHYFNQLDTATGYKKFYAFLSWNKTIRNEMLSMILQDPENVKLNKEIKRLNMESKLK